jgi:hypothetical protein
MEKWNSGKMGLGYCNVGLMAIIVLTTKLKMDNILYSKIEAKT